jgi:hypothetical protein
MVKLIVTLYSYCLNIDVLTDWKQFIVNFHTVTKAPAEEEIRADLEIFQDIKIEFEAFILPHGN